MSEVENIYDFGISWISAWNNTPWSADSYAKCTEVKTFEVEIMK